MWKIDKTGSVWRGLPKICLNEKGQRCMGGKQAKQGNTRAFFFVTAEGGKEPDPIVIENMQNYAVSLI